MSDPWTDPFVLRGLAIFAGVLCFVAVLCFQLTRLSERLERRTPAHLRPLEAAYARFHGFLLAVRLAALRRTRG